MKMEIRAMTRSLVVWTLLGAVAVLAGCQTAPMQQAQPAGICRDRPFEAGLCYQDTNWRLFSPQW
jgi:hypothetical protein